MKNYLISSMLFSVLVLSVLSFSSCDTTLSGCPKDVYKDECLREVVFKIYNADSTENLLAINSNRYNKDSVKIYDEQMNEAVYTIDIDGAAYLSLTENDYPINTEIDRTFYIFLKEADTGAIKGKTDIDTINFNYSLYYECDFFQFNEFQALYNSILQFSSNNSCSSRFILYKK